MCNQSTTVVDLVVRLKCQQQYWAEGRHAGDSFRRELFRQRVPQTDAEALAPIAAQIPVPHLPARYPNARTHDSRPRQPLTCCSRPIVDSYHGGFLVDDAWRAVMDQFGMRDEVKYWRARRIDPVVWFYTLTIERA